jgi:hypothetical protein
VETDKKGHYILRSEVEKAIKVMRDQKATGDYDVLQLVSKATQLISDVQYTGPAMSLNFQ